jgi:hypothetical protein
VGDFYGTGIEIWMDLGQLAVLKKRVWANYEELLKMFFSCFQGQNLKKKISKDIETSALKSCII